MPQRIAGTMTRNEPTTTSAIDGGQLPSIDFQVPISDCWLSVIERILVKLEIADCQSVGDPIGNRFVEGGRESREIICFCLVSESRQGANSSSGDWYRAEIGIAVHGAVFRCAEGATTSRRDAAGYQRERINAEHRGGSVTSLFNYLEVVATLVATS